MTTTDGSGTESWTTVRARAAAKRKHDPGADISEEQRDLAAMRLEKVIREVVDSFPLTNKQRVHLANLIITGGR